MACAVIAVEGNSIPEVIAGSVVTIALIVYNKALSDTLIVLEVCAITLITVLLTEVFYIFLFGGFVPPSKMIWGG